MKNCANKPLIFYEYQTHSTFSISKISLHSFCYDYLWRDLRHFCHSYNSWLQNHPLQAKPPLSPVGSPERGSWASISSRHSSEPPSPALSTKKYPILSKHWHTAYTDTGAGLQRKKNVNFQIEWHLAHQPDCPAVLHCHVQSAAGFLLENKLHWIRSMPEALLGRDIAALFAFFFLIFLGFLVTTLGLYKTYWSALSILMVMTKTSSVTWDSLKKHYKSEGFFSFNRLFHVRWIFI